MAPHAAAPSAGRTETGSDRLYTPALTQMCTLRALLTFVLVLHFILGEAVFSLPSPACSICSQATHKSAHQAKTDCAAHHQRAACPLKKQLAAGHRETPSLACAIACTHHGSPVIPFTGKPFLLPTQVRLPFLCPFLLLPLFFCSAYPDGYVFPLIKPPSLTLS
jgi:hypothetical protein